MRLRRNLITLMSAKIIAYLVHILSRSFSFGEGSNVPGRIVLRILPNILSLMVPRFKNGWIMITGTNGKTTTTKILVELLQGSGYRVCTNASGANLLSGIVTSLLLADISFFEEFIADYAVFEIDEAVLIKSYKLFQPKVLVLTNFSRDQLDRYGEVDTNVDHIRELVNNTGGQCKVVLNGNDLNLVGIGSVVKPENRFYFGMQQKNAPKVGLSVKQGTVIELAALDLPQLDLWADTIRSEYLSGSHFKMGYGCETINVDLQLPGVFNILNALAAVAVCLTVGIQLDRIKAILSIVKSSYGRSEHFFYQGASVFMFLVKNPVGFNNILQLLNQAHGAKRILILLNDLTADGKDVSWIWDVDLENLWKVTGIKEVVASGTRAGDIALLVKYSYPPEIPLCVDYSPKRAFKELVKRLMENEELLILANYTAMTRIRPFLLKATSSKYK